MSVTVFLAKAIICFSGQCYPVLVGDNTPTGEFQLQKLYVAHPGYGGDVLKFDEDDKMIYAIHRVWTQKPSERRPERLASPDVKQRIGVTNGCINLTPAVYTKLMNCCSKDKVTIVKE